MSPNTLTGGGTEQMGGDKNILKMGGGQAGSRGGCLKKGGGWNPLQTMSISNMFHKVLNSKIQFISWAELYVKQYDKL